MEFPSFKLISKNLDQYKLNFPHNNDCLKIKYFGLVFAFNVQIFILTLLYTLIFKQHLTVTCILWLTKKHYNVSYTFYNIQSSRFKSRKFCSHNIFMAIILSNINIFLIKDDFQAF